MSDRNSTKRIVSDTSKADTPESDKQPKQNPVKVDYSKLLTSQKSAFDRSPHAGRGRKGYGN